MVHRCAGRNLIGESGKIGGRSPATRRMPDIVTQKAHRKHPPTSIALNTRGGMKRKHVKADCISGLDLPPDYWIVLASRLDVR
jgi:hypothetical protein